jgi:hypothetical protein
MRRLCIFAAASAVALSLAVTSPAFAQWIVFDPNNYAQNVLTAARELQQINNQITSLQNQAQMLINQAKNLANAILVAAATSIVDPAHASNCWLRPSALPMMYSRSTARSRPIMRRRRAANPIKHSSPTRNRGGRTRSPRCRTPCVCRPALSATSTPTAPRRRRS